MANPLKMKLISFPVLQGSVAPSINTETCSGSNFHPSGGETCKSKTNV